MKKAIPYIWKGLGLLVILVAGLFLRDMIQEKRIASAFKKKAGEGGEVVPKQAPTGFAQKVRR